MPADSLFVRFNDISDDLFLIVGIKFYKNFISGFLEIVVLWSRENGRKDWV